MWKTTSSPLSSVYFSKSTASAAGSASPAVFGPAQPATRSAVVRKSARAIGRR